MHGVEVVPDQLRMNVGIAETITRTQPIQLDQYGLQRLLRQQPSRAPNDVGFEAFNIDFDHLRRPASRNRVKCIDSNRHCMVASFTGRQYMVSRTKLSRELEFTWLGANTHIPGINPVIESIKMDVVQQLP